MSKYERPERRISDRYETNIETNIVCSNEHNKFTITGQILNASSSGLLITTESELPPNSSCLSLSFPMPVTGQPINLLTKVMWYRKSEVNRSGLSGISITDTFAQDEKFKNFVDSLSTLSQKKDRRNGDLHGKYPLKNRFADYEDVSGRSPYLSFFQNLRQVADEQRIDTLILSKSLMYLKKRARQIIGDEPRIISDEVLEGELPGNNLLVVNLECRRKHESYTLLDFEEYRLQCSGISEPLRTLFNVSRHLRSGIKINVLSLGEFQNKKLVTKYLNMSRLEKINFLSGNRLSCEKRELFNQEIKDGKFILQEVESLKDIERIQEFSSTYYSPSFDFSKEIDGLFNHHSHFYQIVRVPSGELVTCARVSWQLPNQFLPCMLAHKKGTDHHLQLHNPDEISYGEIYAPYFNSYSAIKTYGALVKRFCYYYDENFINVFFTTYDAAKPLESKFLNKYLGFHETNVALKYGGFGGTWNLIFSSKENLTKHLSFNFRSPTESPRLINAFRPE